MRLLRFMLSKLSQLSTLKLTKNFLSFARLILRSGAMQVFLLLALALIAAAVVVILSLINGRLENLCFVLTVLKLSCAD